MFPLFFEIGETMNDLNNPYIGQTDIAVITPLDTIFADYNRVKKEIVTIANYVKDANGSAMSYFFDGARVKKNTGTYSATTFFNAENAIDSLNAEYWQRMMAYTDILDIMPAKLRNEWNENIQKHETPEFEINSVRATMNELLMKRSVFFAQRVDGIFKSLSSTHLTNQPQGFGKTMIIDRMLDWYKSVNYQIASFVHDLRVVIAMFMDREVPSEYTTRKSISDIYDNDLCGQWHSFDGGSWKLKLFKKGTAHIAVHKNMAWRLNQVLASLYPMAIPDSFKKKPARTVKEHDIVMDLLPHKVLRELEEYSIRTETALSFKGHNISEETKEILSYLGAKHVYADIWDFGYPAKEVIHEILRSGQVPEQKSHQFYQTPEALAQRLVDLADIQDDHKVLEPSAGFGGIAEHLPKDQTTCVDVNNLHVKVLEKKGYNAFHNDFIRMDFDSKFDRILMNPPFSGGRAIEHLTKAHSLLKDDGKLLAILPASMKGNTYFEGWKHDWSDVLINEFKESGTGVNVAILSLSH